MPVYEYKCRECKNKFEIKQSMSEAEIEKCPECGGKVNKIISSAAINFKGSGFYVNDNKKSCPNADLSSGSPCSSCPNAEK